MPILQPRCRNCGRKWSPKDGVDAEQSYCRRCSRDRRSEADRVFAADGKRRVIVGRYMLRSAKHA